MVSIGICCSAVSNCSFSDRFNFTLIYCLWFAQVENLKFLRRMYQISFGLYHETGVLDYKTKKALLKSISSVFNKPHGKKPLTYTSSAICPIFIRNKSMWSWICHWNCNFLQHFNKCQSIPSVFNIDRMEKGQLLMYQTSPIYCLHLFLGTLNLYKSQVAWLHQYYRFVKL